MVERRGQPRRRDVTGAALTRIVIGGLVGRMAGRAIDLPGVIKRGWLPGAGQVARAALTRVVIGGLV